MSAAESIEQIKSLPPGDQAAVAPYLQTLTSARPASEGVDDESKTLADEIFTTNAELFRKLAQ